MVVLGGAGVELYVRGVGRVARSYLSPMALALSTACVCECVVACALGWGGEDRSHGTERCAWVAEGGRAAAGGRMSCVGVWRCMGDVGELATWEGGGRAGG